MKRDKTPKSGLRTPEEMNEIERKYNNKDVVNVWNNAVNECIRIVNAHSRTGMHDHSSIEYYNGIEEKQRISVINDLKKLLKE